MGNPSESNSLKWTRMVLNHLQHDQTLCESTPSGRPCKRCRGIGQSLLQIAPELGLDGRTIRKYLAAKKAPVYPRHRPRPTQMSPYLTYLAVRWAQGCHNRPMAVSRARP